MEESNVVVSMEQFASSISSNNLLSYSVSSSPLDENGSNSSGRWTQDEHELFLRGLKLYNRQWKQIADIIKTRTVVQIRTHAQKYFQKLNKCNKSIGSVTKNIDEGVKMKTLPNTPSPIPLSPKDIKEKSASKKQSVKDNVTTNSLFHDISNDKYIGKSESNMSGNTKISNDLSDFEWLASPDFPSANDEKTGGSLPASSLNCDDISNKVQSSEICNDDYIDFSWLVENDLVTHSTEYAANITYTIGMFDLSSNDSSSGTSEESLSNHDGDEEMSHPFDNENLFTNPPMTHFDEIRGAFAEKKRSYSCSTYEDMSLQKKRGRPLKLRRQLSDNISNDYCHGQDNTELCVSYVDACDDEFNIFGLIDL